MTSRCCKECRTLEKMTLRNILTVYMLVVIMNVSFIITFSLQRNQRSWSVCADHFNFIIIIVTITIIIIITIIITTLFDEVSTSLQNTDNICNKLASTYSRS